MIDAGIVPFYILKSVTVLMKRVPIRVYFVGKVKFDIVLKNAYNKVVLLWRHGR